MTYEPAVLGRRRLPRQSENSGDDGEEDVAPRSIPPGTVMSHFFLPGAITTLAPSVIQGAELPPLVVPCGATNGVTPGKLSASSEAVDIAAITAAADQDLLAAAAAGVDSMGGRSAGLFRHERLDKSDDSPEDAR